MIGQSRLTGPDGEELILVFDHAGRLAAEDAADVPLAKLVEQGFAGRLGFIGALLYGGLRRHHPRLTLDQAHAIVGKAVDGGVIMGLQAAMVKALTASMPRSEGEEENPPPAPSGTGTCSSAPGVKRASSRKPSGGKRPAASR